MSIQGPTSEGSETTSVVRPGPIVATASSGPSSSHEVSWPVAAAIASSTGSLLSG